MMRRPPRSPPFPYPTLFRSRPERGLPALVVGAGGAHGDARHGRRLGDRQVLIEHEVRSEEHTSELQSQSNLVCRLLLEKKTERSDIPDARHMPQSPSTTTCD